MSQMNKTLILVLLSLSAIFSQTIVSISAGDEHTLALGDDGKLYAWGMNEYGELGDGNGAFGIVSDVPVEVDMTGALSGKTITQVSAGAYHSLALDSDGKVYGWGSNLWGQLGDGNGGDFETISTTPVAVDMSGVLSGKTVTQIIAVGDHSLVLTSDNKIFAWGNNLAGQLGDGSTTDAIVPIATDMSGRLSGKTIDKLVSGYSHAMVLTSDDSLFAWGTGEFGQLGEGSVGFGILNETPTGVDMTGVMSGKTITDISAAGDHSLALASDGSLFAWGSNWDGQLGDDDGGFNEFFEGIVSEYPVAVNMNFSLSGKTVSTMDAGGYHSLVQATDGTLHAFGRNESGQMGDGNSGFGVIADSSVAVDMSGALNGKTISSISSGGNHTTVLTSDGAVYTWGANWSGQLGNGAGGGFEDLSAVPVAVALAMPMPELTINPTAIDFGEVAVGDSAILTIGIENSAFGTLHVDAPSIVGSGAAQFSINEESFSVESGYDTTLTIKFKPITDGDFIAALSLTSDGGDASIGLNGTGAGPELTVNQSALDFGQVIVGYSDTLDLTISNTGLALLTVDAPDITGGNADAFSVVSDISLTIPQGESRTLSIKFKPKPGSGGYHTASLDLTSDGGTANVNLSGNGRLIPVTQISSGLFNGLAMAEDGQIYGWGYGYHGELGQGVNDASRMPVETVMDGALAGKQIKTIEAGGDHAMALSEAGNIYTWGYGRQGQMGDGSQNWSNVPVTIDTNGVLSGKTVTTVTGGGSYTLILTDEGTIYGWGMNSFGQIGLGYTTTGTSGILSPTAVRTDGVLNGKTLKSIAGALSHSLALSDDGKLYAWGQGHVGQLGNGGFVDSYVPVEVTMTGALAGKNVTNISSGQNYSLVLTDDGKLYSWGRNNEGQLGNGGTDSSSVPVAVVMNGALANQTVRAIAAGSHHAFVLTTDNQLFSWGKNNVGQLGNGSTVGSSNVPVVVTIDGELSGKMITTISADGDNSYVLTDDGEVYVWGDNTYDQLGEHDESYINEPVFIFGGGLVVEPQLTVATTALDFGQVAPGDSLFKDLVIMNTGLAILNVDAPAITGADAAQFRVIANPLSIAAGDSATLSIGFKPMAEGTFTASLDLSSDGGDVSVALEGAGVVEEVGVKFKMIAATAYTSFAISEGGVLYTWGKNTSGQLGDGTNENRESPVPVDVSGALLGKEVVEISGGDSHTLFLTADNKLFSSGGNSQGQLGTGSNTGSNVAVPVDVGGALFGKTITAIAAGQYHSILSTSDGQVFTWGGNSQGQLGDGTTNGSNVPVAVDMSGVLSGKVITSVYAAAYSLALSDDGKLYSWGINNRAQLGNGTSDNSSIPTEVDMSGVLSGKTVTAVSGGASHSIAQTSDNSLYAWGYNYDGQLGAGIPTTSSFAYSPVAVDLNGVLAGKRVVVFSAGTHTLVATDDGNLYSWGANWYGGLGTGDETSQNVPVPVDMTGALKGEAIGAISVGWGHSLALSSDGDLYAWGGNSSGQLGNGTFEDSNVPVYVFGGGLEPVALAELELTPENYKLYSNFPNPFNPVTTIRYDLPEVADVSLTIYDIRGRMVSTMTEYGQGAGVYEVQWHGTDDNGQAISTGVYLARIQAGSYSKTIKMLYLK